MGMHHYESTFDRLLHLYKHIRKFLEGSLVPRLSRGGVERRAWYMLQEILSSTCRPTLPMPDQRFLVVPSLYQFLRLKLAHLTMIIAEFDASIAASAAS